MLSSFLHLRNYILLIYMRYRHSVTSQHLTRFIFIWALLKNIWIYSSPHVCVLDQLWQSWSVFKDGFVPNLYLFLAKSILVIKILVSYRTCFLLLLIDSPSYQVLHERCYRYLFFLFYFHAFFSLSNLPLPPSTLPLIDWVGELLFRQLWNMDNSILIVFHALSASLSFPGKNDPFCFFPLVPWRHQCLIFGADLAGKVKAGCPYLQRPATTYCSSSSSSHSDCFSNQMKTVCSISTHCRVQLDKRRLFIFDIHGSIYNSKTASEAKNIECLFSICSSRYILADEVKVCFYLSFNILQRQDNWFPLTTNFIRIVSSI